MKYRQDTLAPNHRDQPSSPRRNSYLPGQHEMTWRDCIDNIDKDRKRAIHALTMHIATPGATAHGSRRRQLKQVINITADLKSSLTFTNIHKAVILVPCIRSSVSLFPKQAKSLTSQHPSVRPSHSPSNQRPCTTKAARVGGCNEFTG